MRIIAISLGFVVALASPTAAPAAVSSPQTRSGAETTPGDEPPGWVPAAGHGLGGYWQASERRPPRPPPARESIIIGSAMSSLGLLRIGLGIWPLASAISEKCPRDQSWGGKWALGWINLGFGSAMLAVGLAYWTVATVRLLKQRRWDRRWKLGVRRRR